MNDGPGDRQTSRRTFRLGFIPKTRQILKGITFSVREGEIFGYLGPERRRENDDHQVPARSHPPGRRHDRDLRPASLLAALPPDARIPSRKPLLLRLSHGHGVPRPSTADLFGLDRAEKEKRIARLLKLVDLERVAGLSLRKYSRGMLQRVGLAQALINDPELVILDEPLGGIDPLGRKEIRDIIVRFKDEGKTVFLYISHPPGHRDDLRPGGHHRRRPHRQARAPCGISSRNGSYSPR